MLVISLGMVPESVLFSIMNSTNLLSLPNSVGMLPDTWLVVKLPCRRQYLRLRRLPTSVGIWRMKRDQSILKTCSFRRLPISVGMVVL